MIKQIAFKNSQGAVIQGVLKEKHASDRLIIICHGYKSSHKHPGIVGVTNQLYEMGDATFAFNFSSSTAFDLRQQVGDINAVIAYFGKKRKLILLGGSFGALVCALAASQNSFIAGLITVNGFFGGAQLSGGSLGQYLIFRTLYLVKKSHQDIWKYLQDNLKPEKITIRTLVIHAKHDKQVSPVQSQKFFKKISGEKEFFVLENADHHLTRESYQKETAEVIDKWLKKVV